MNTSSKRKHFHYCGYDPQPFLWFDEQQPTGVAPGEHPFLTVVNTDTVCNPPQLVREHTLDKNDKHGTCAILPTGCLYQMVDHLLDIRSMA